MITSAISRKAERIITSEYTKIEEELISYFVDAMIEGKSVDDIADWRRRKLGELAKYFANWESVLEKLMAERMSAIDEMLEDAFSSSANFDEKVLKQAFKSATAGISSESFSLRLRLMTQTAHWSMNLTNTQALAKMQQDFLQAVNSVYIRVVNGISTLEQAIKDACYQYAKHGATVQYYTDSGRILNYHLDSAVRRNVMTTLVQTASAYTLERNQEYGNYLVQVSSHFGARPSHAEWQGGVYWYGQEVAGYSGLVEVTDYGSATGLCGINCRHTFWPYFAGLSKDDLDIPDLEENEKQYEAQQQQRAYERKLREYKRELIATKATGDTARTAYITAQQKALRSEYLSFLSDAGLTRMKEREAIH